MAAYNTIGYAMTNQSNLNDHDYSEARNLFSFSILSAALAILGGFTLLVATLYATVFVGTQTGQLTDLALQQVRSKSFPSKLEETRQMVNQSEEAAQFAVFIVWSLAGLLLCTTASAVVFGFKASQGAVSAVWFSPRNGRARVAEEIAARVGIRTLGILGLYVLYKLALLASPYLLIWIAEVRYEQSIVMIATVSGAMFVIGLFSVYVASLMLRLVTLRTRVFL